MRQLNAMHRTQDGFTLIELAIALSIIGILAAAALPTLASYTANSQLRESANVVLANALIAKSEAIKRNAIVNLQISGNALRVVTNDTPTPLVLKFIPIPDAVHSPNFTASFDSAGRLTPFGTELALSLSSSRLACSSDIRCPTVHFDAGGSIRVCSTGVCP